LGRLFLKGAETVGSLVQIRPVAIFHFVFSYQFSVLPQEKLTHLNGTPFKLVAILLKLPDLTEGQADGNFSFVSGFQSPVSSLIQKK